MCQRGGPREDSSIVTAQFQLRFIGPEPGESYLFVKWLARRHQSKLAVVRLRVGNADLFDRVLVTEFTQDDLLVRVASSFPESSAARGVVLESLLRKIDGAMVVLARRRREAETNARAWADLLPRLRTMGVEPRVVFNDSARGDENETVSAAEAAAGLGLGAFHETTLGPPKGAIEYDDGVEAAWLSFLEASMKSKRTTPYR